MTTAIGSITAFSYFLLQYSYTNIVFFALKEILYSYLILKKMNERTSQQTVNISTNIHNERIKTKYIPAYIF